MCLNHALFLDTLCHKIEGNSSVGDIFTCAGVPSDDVAIRRMSPLCSIRRARAKSSRQRIFGQCRRLQRRPRH
jgi:hypothetical protein